MPRTIARLATTAVVSTALMVTIGPTGCRTTGRTAGGTRIDRLMNTYPALATGRFVVVADFEDPSHMELVTLNATSPSAKFAYDERGGRPDTGTGCLKVTLAKDTDAVILSNRASSSWYLKRDWRDYDSMILAVHAPRSGVSLDITVASGGNQNRLVAGTTDRLHDGWNVLELPLADVAERIAIDDVREVRFSILGLDKPTEFRFDDIILTADRGMVLGDMDNTTGDLYVQRVAKRFHVGAGGSFELTFANGQIVQWFNLGADPHRLSDLVKGTTLGPTPVVLGDASGGNAGFDPLGSAVLAQQRLLEASPVRVVLECLWYFVDDPEAPIDLRPRHRWLYTIYPTGDIFVSVEAAVANESWSAPNVGLAVTVNQPAADPLDVGIGSIPADPGRHQGTYAWAGRPDRGGYLLFVVPSPLPTATILTPTAEETGQLSLVATGATPPGNPKSWHAVLKLNLEGDTNIDQVALATANAYINPAQLDLEVGSPAETDALGNSLDAGYDRATGTYVLVADGGRCRLKVRDDDTTYAPLGFTLLESAGLDAWVYVNYVLHEPTARDRSGNLIFRLPGALAPGTPLEILTRRADTFSKP